MKKSYLIHLACFMVLAGILSCQRNAVPEIEVVAQVEDLYLTRTELLNWMPREIPADQKKVLAEQYIDRWVKTVTLYLAAKSDQVKLDDYSKWSLEYLQRQMLADKYVEKKQSTRLLVTDEDISRYYENHKEEFKRDKDEVHLVQLYLEKLDNAITKEISSAEYLLDVIEKNYLNNLGNRLFEQNGDLGYVPVEDLRSEIRRRIISGRTGKIYGPIKIDDGYFYFQMMDKKDANTIRNLENVKNDIWMMLTKIKMQKEQDNIAEAANKMFDIKIYPEHIQ